MHVWCRMLFLTCSSKLATLRKALTHSFPESLKACGALHHVINKNSFNLQVLVDQWPDFTSVICRPPLEEMTDPSDRYTNTYFLFSKDQQRLSEMLQNPHVINWTQELQIQGCQTELGEVLRDVSAKHRSGIRFTSNILYMRDSIQSSEVPEQPDSTSELQFSSLSPHEAFLVNAGWMFGGNQHSLRYVERCIQRLPTFCVRKKGVEHPVSWALCEQSSEIRMGYTEPAYRKRGLNCTLILMMAAANHRNGAPLYCHVAHDNKASQSVTLRAGFKVVGAWEQWNFQPL
ncbi:glycine N-acyltransferase-like isoform 4-T4 [Discoglossus pictus]